MKNKSIENPTSQKIFNDLCKSICGKEKNIQACFVVGLKVGLVIGHHQKVFENPSDTYIRTVFDTVMSFYRNQQVLAFAAELQEAWTLPLDAGPDEMYFSIGGLRHFIKYIPGQQTVFVLAVKTSVTQGLGWIFLQKALPEVMNALQTFLSEQRQQKNDYATQEFVIQPSFMTRIGDPSPQPMVRRKPK